MEKIRINDFKIIELAKKGLVDIGYPENIEISSYVGDDDTPVYYATYEIEDISEKHIKPLRVKDIIMLVKHAMEMEGYDSPNLDIRVRDGQIHYSVVANIVTYGTGKGHSKRRR